MLAKRPEIESRLDDALEDIAATDVALAEIDADLVGAIDNPARYAALRTKRDGVVGEKERLTKLVSALELERNDFARDEAEANLRRRHAEKLISNEELAVRIRSDLERINEVALSLLRDVARSMAEDIAINAALPDDLPRLVTAEFIARGRPALERHEISTDRIWLWVKAGTNFVIGDQYAVNDLGNGKGAYEAGMSKFSCEAKLFDKVEFNPPQSMERPHSLFAMKLVSPDGPGVVYNGDPHFKPASVLAALERLASHVPPERAVEFELRPVAEIVASADNETAQSKVS